MGVPLRLLTLFKGGDGTFLIGSKSEAPSDNNGEEGVDHE